ncbi:tymocyte protein cThy28kD [Synechococcus sp. 60AY4M2]|jgi:predicted RNA-binding protein with PUA-like domain|uniref:EVE domain-containing protein n=1 Tax=unclassified Synechococcus TaxID=2626047 RepID=UPI000C1A8463|nr:MULTISPECIES: EVE domain-containing protein [unclassified Synechococcus]PIK94519.1 tymocyte protein cThy28kD [Synechococcus sp. 60AY4M2]PIK96776.1 tymocyte protein cThy28kD [Synechococcus sp. 63AY4M1]PIK99531.1 tymocyte protein cThy28kD [Synechococcus sp. 65AY640]
MNYWLMKSEPSVYSIWDLQREGQTLWDGVRNYQARNYLKAMQVGDRAFFYHSNANPPGIAGLMEIVETQVVDPSQFDPTSPYYDPKATPAAPRWYTVRVQFVAAFGRLIPLAQLRATFTPAELEVVRRGTRLSVMPVPQAVAERLLALAAVPL